MDAEIEGELARMCLRRYKMTPLTMLHVLLAPLDGQVIQATTDEDGNFIFTVRSSTFSPVLDGQEIPYA
jgi:hypothetical protein